MKAPRVQRPTPTASARSDGAPVDATRGPKPGEKYFTRKELAQLLKISVRKVDSMVAYREIPVLRLGKLVRFRLEDVERVLNETMLTGKETFNTPTA